ncbi:hypothetical protein BDR07DRAFT_953996 [Suillus spraguei]|nr:hypothetical protein BDR07DRAFT_953996 [Suillus spraguei]
MEMDSPNNTTVRTTERYWHPSLAVEFNMLLLLLITWRIISGIVNDMLLDYQVKVFACTRCGEGILSRVIVIREFLKDVHPLAICRRCKQVDRQRIYFTRVRSRRVSPLLFRTTACGSSVSAQSTTIRTSPAPADRSWTYEKIYKIQEDRTYKEYKGRLAILPFLRFILSVMTRVSPQFERECGCVVF